MYVGRSLFGESGAARVFVPAAARGLTGVCQTARLVAFRDSGPYLKALGDQRPDLIHAHFGIDGVYAAPLARRLGVPLVTTLHGFDVTRTDADLIRSGRPALVNGVLFRRELQRQGAKFLCVSEFIRQAALRRGYPEERLQVHYIGIDVERIRPREGAGEDGLIVHVARLVEKKGTRYLLEALARILPAQPNARLVILGDGPLRPALEAQAQALGIAGRVTFLGMRPNHEVLAWDARAAVKAVPSITGPDGDQEGLPTVITETSALAVPVVAFASGGITEAVLHEKTGFISPEGDVEGLAHHLNLLLSSPDLRLRMGQAARQRAEAHFSVRSQTAQLELIYDDVLSAAE